MMDKARAVIRRTLERLAYHSESLMKDQAAEELVADLDKAGCLKPEPVPVIEQKHVDRWLKRVLGKRTARKRGFKAP